jgi:hypothetical protein
VKFYASNLLPRDIPQRQRACLPCLRPWVQPAAPKGQKRVLGNKTIFGKEVNIKARVKFQVLDYKNKTFTFGEV